MALPCMMASPKLTCAACMHASMQVLRERVLGPDSSFQPYISSLPVGVPGIPIFFSPEAVEVLGQYPPLR